MTDRVLLSASPQNIQECVDLAVEQSLGIELMAFAYPDLLDGDWKATVESYKPLLEPVRGMITMHGPFMDMTPGSPDKRVNKVCIERYQHAIRIAYELGVEVIVFHANFIASMQSEIYRTGWQERNVVFWNHMADYARQHDVMLAVENMWEFDPDIIGDVLKQVNHAHLGACLDIGHAHLFSKVPFADWLTALRPYLIHTHINNNDMLTDIHRALPDGKLEYTPILDSLRALPNPPTMTLEMDSVNDMRASLSYFKLPESDAVWRGQVSQK